MDLFVIKLIEYFIIIQGGWACIYNKNRNYIY